ncbi:MAG: hypothetical protein U5S82_22750 [Gammaproteobacteria bacterium]|nr:hypothetical protein [Gammaproteobacteria bacterium]
MGEHSMPASHPVAARTWRGRFLLPVIAAAPLLLGGCAGLIQLASHPVMTGMGLVSVAVSGKGLADHALDMVTRRDCRLLEGLVKEERALCEEPGSLATLDDFRGLGWFARDGGGRDIALALDTRLDGSNGPPSFTTSGREAPDAGIRLALSMTPIRGTEIRPAQRPAGAPAPEDVALLQ